MPMKPCTCLLLIIYISVLTACSNRRPDDIPSPGKMERILIDYHTAQAMAERLHTDSATFYTYLYTEAALQKHGLTNKQFEKALIYYIRHSEQLNKMYKHITEQLGEINTSTNDPNAIAFSASSADTLLLWSGAPYYLLSNITGTGRIDFSLENDTAFAQGGQAVLQFKSEWMQHEGARTAAVLLAACYENDSTVSTHYRLNTSGTHQVRLPLQTTPRKLLRLEGFIYQTSPYTPRPRLLLIQAPVLFRMQGAKTIPAQLSLDSLRPSPRDQYLERRKFIRDSLHLEEKKERERVHF